MIFTIHPTDRSAYTVHSEAAKALVKRKNHLIFCT